MHPPVFYTSFIFFLLTSIRINAQDKASFAIQWREWEYNFVSAKENSSDLQPEIIEVKFKGPKSLKFTTPAFTDDRIHYTVRAAFPSTGSWTWESTGSDHSDHGLHNVKGRVEVATYSGNNPLYLHGDLIVSENFRFLSHADGTPFFWLGDSGQDVISKASMEDWERYIDIRAGQGYSVINVIPRAKIDTRATIINTGTSFTESGLNDTLFWNDLEQKIRYANNKGMFVMLSGTGTDWRDQMSLNAENQEFTSYLAARMASLMVIFSPGYEQVFTDDLDRLSAELKRQSTHLVTQFPISTSRSNLTFSRTTTVDFAGLNIDDPEADVSRLFYFARQWTTDLFAGVPVKPIILISSVKDKSDNGNPGYIDELTRKTGWVSLLSGAKGYTSGSVYLPRVVPVEQGAGSDMVTDTIDNDNEENISLAYGSSFITFMRDFFKSINWWDLMPAQDLIRNQEVADTLQMVAARTPDLNTIVAYLPSNKRIVLNMMEYPFNLRYLWFNPATGEALPDEKVSGGSANEIFNRPEGWNDAVLLIFRKNT